MLLQMALSTALLWTGRGLGVDAEMAAAVRRAKVGIMAVNRVLETLQAHFLGLLLLTAIAVWTAAGQLRQPVGSGVAIITGRVGGRRIPGIAKGRKG